MADDFILEPARRIPVSHTADVVVAGGGTAGVAAAVCAARLGLSVVMVERTAIPGGMVTHVTFWLNDFANKGGFAREFMDHLESGGLYQRPYYNPFLVTPYFDDLIRDAGIRPLYLATVVAPLIEDGRLGGVIVESKSGRTAIRARVVIDATGDGDVAALAGAQFRVGRESDGACQSITLSHLLMHYTGGSIPRDRMRELALEAGRRAGTGYSLPYDRWGAANIVGTHDSLLHGVAHATGYDPLSADGLSDCLLELRRQARELFDTLKNHTEEFRDVEFGPFSAIPGIRESRRIVCDAHISHADALSGARRSDGLFLVTQAIDIHRCIEGEPPIVVIPVQPYHVPYGALLPRGLENLMVVGRCISGDHEALASYRIIADCFAMGEAAALAAKLSIERDCTPRQVPAEQVVNEMRNRGYEQ